MDVSVSGKDAPLVAPEVFIKDSKHVTLRSRNPLVFQLHTGVAGPIVTDPNMFTFPGEGMEAVRWKSFTNKNKNVKILAASLPSSLRGKGIKWGEVKAFYEVIYAHTKKPW